MPDGCHLPDALGHWSSVYHRWRRWYVRGWWELVFEAMRPSLPADGLLLLDSTTCKAHRAASGAARNTAAAEALGRSRGGICSKLHACVDGAGRVLRLIAKPGQHSDLRCATALASGIPACDIALRWDRTRQSWMGFAHLAATMINLRVAKFSHTP